MDPEVLAILRLSVYQLLHLDRVPASAVVDDAVNLAASQVAKMRFNVPRSIARVNDPKNEKLFRQLSIDDTVSPTRSILGVIEHEIPIHDLLHLAELEGGEVQIVVHEPGRPAPFADIGDGEVELRYVSPAGDTAAPVNGAPPPGIWNVLLRARETVRRVPDLTVLSMVPISERRGGRIGR